MKKMRLTLFLALVLCLTVVLCACQKPEASKNEVLSITVSEKNISFTAPGESAEITATVVPSTAEDKTLVWSSTNESVAVVENGKIYALGWGVCVVRVTATNGVSNTVIVSVGETKPSLTLSESSILFNELGKEVTIIPSAPGAGVTAEELQWFSSNASVATCVNGKVTATGFGVCTITARMANGLSVDCVVIVEVPDLAYCEISETELFFQTINTTHTLSANVSNDENMPISWLSSNDKVATVDGGVVKATGEGVCAVIAVAENGLTDVCIVTVGTPEEDVNPFTSLLDFSVVVPATSKYVNKATGQIASELTIIDAVFTVVDKNTVEGLLDGELGVIVELRCVKTFDRDGKDGHNAVALTASVHLKENGENAFQTKYPFVCETDCKIGYEYTEVVHIKIKANPNEQRVFSISIDPYSIL